MNQEKPKEPVPQGVVETIDLGGAVEQRELKKRQRMEMLREGYQVSYGGLPLEYVGEETKEDYVVKLRSPDGMVTSVPVEMLMEDDWTLVPK
ncbi:MAG TPA: hypothetical protein VMJ72_00725 [Candidatus Paceibacterota bacterium]|nr:hypothetical protein [Candidatus Paceibacterota bacterium]